MLNITACQSAIFVFQNLSLPNLHSRHFYSDFLVLSLYYIDQFGGSLFSVKVKNKHILCPE